MKHEEKWNVLRRKIRTLIGSLGVENPWCGLYFQTLQRHRTRLIDILEVKPGICLAFGIRTEVVVFRLVYLRKISCGAETILIGETSLPSESNLNMVCRALSLLSECGYLDYSLQCRCGELWLTYARRIQTLTDCREVHHQLIGLADTADHLHALLPE
jgi:hypothetical protein